MKYQITLDNKTNINNPYILYDLNYEDLILENPELDLTISKVGKLSFSIYPDHPFFNRLEKKSSKISVLKNGRTIFRGRIVEDEQGLFNNKSILCESTLAYLNDSIVRPGTFSGSPLEFLTMLINNHNSQVSDEQKLLLGNVTVEDPNNYISRSWEEYLSTWEVLEKRGIELIGGYIVERYENNGTYIDWVEDFDDTSTQEIEFGENIIDIFATNNASNTYSVIIPLGAEIENADGTKERLTVKSVNDNKDYLTNEAALNNYGWIVAPVSETTWDDVTIASNLKRKGQEWLDNQGVMIESEFEITALDLQATDKNIESFFIYEYVRIKSTPHNIDKRLLLNSIKIPLAHPENTQITIGESTNTLTGIELGNKNNIDNITNRVNIVETNYEINNGKLNDLENAVKYFSVDLSQYNITIPTDSSNKPLTTKNYDVNFYGYYKGQQVTPTVSITGTNTGITTSKTSTYVRFAVNTNTAIANALNEYSIKFTYTVDSISYEITKVVDIALAIKGTDGTGGQPGKDGQDGKSAYQIWLDEGNTGTEEEYLASLKGEDGKDGVSTYTHIKYSANADGTNYTSSPTSTTKYMGIAVTTSQTAPTDKGGYTWSEIKGEDGTNGVNGQDGADGVTYYTWIKYADTPTSGMSNTPDNKKYMGIAYNKTSSTESSNYGDYAWSLIKGNDGSNGQPGADGEDGLSSYIHVRYSANSTGNPMTTTPDSNTQYLGTATTNSSTAPTSYTVYTWVKTKGEQGLQGLQGEKGEQGVAGPKGDNGATSYFHIKYSSVANPTSSSQMTETPNTYIGTYVDFTQNDSTDPSKYTWSQFKGSQGAKGEQGIAGTNGANGETSYLHIAYATNSTGTSGFSVSDSTNKTYIGQYTDFIQEDSTDATKYSWTKIKGDTGAKGDKGDKGEQGIQGATGKDGTSYYFYVRYSANANGNPMTTAPQSTTKYMGVASTTSTTAPTSYSGYTWTLIKGADGQNGTNGSPGQPGADGKSSYLHIKYSDDGTTFTANEGETVGRYRGELVDNTEADSTTFSDYTWYDMALIVDEELKGIREEFETNLTTIQKDNETIMMEALRDYVSVDEFGTFKETVSTNYTQTADDFTFDFNKITERVTEFEGITQREFEELKKYIRFVDGKVIIGEIGNEYTLVQKNDRISFMQGNTEVAYISNTKMVVTDGEFLNSLRIGNFAWKPRENGNLSLVYVGGEIVG